MHSLYSFHFSFGFHNTLKGNECIPLRFFLIEGLCFHRDSKGMNAFPWFFSHFFSEGLCFHILSSFLFFQSFIFAQRKGMSFSFCFWRTGSARPLKVSLFCGSITHQHHLFANYKIIWATSPQPASAGCRDTLFPHTNSSEAILQPWENIRSQDPSQYTKGFDHNTVFKSSVCKDSHKLCLTKGVNINNVNENKKQKTTNNYTVESWLEARHHRKTHSKK